MRLVRLPLVTPFTIATGTMHEKLFPLLTLRSDGLEGYAEGVMDPLPDYLEETRVGGGRPAARGAFAAGVRQKLRPSRRQLARHAGAWRGQSHGAGDG